MSSVRAILHDLGCGVRYYIDGEFEWGLKKNTVTKDTVNKILLETYQSRLEEEMPKIFKPEDEDQVRYPSFYEAVLKSTSEKVVAKYKESKRNKFPTIEEIIKFCNAAVQANLYLKDPLDRVRSELLKILNGNKDNPFIQELNKEYKLIVETMESGKSESEAGKIHAHLQVAFQTALIPVTADKIHLQTEKANAVTQLLSILEISSKQFDLIKDEADRQASLKSHKERQAAQDKKRQDRKAKFIEERKRELSTAKKEPEWKTNMEMVFKKVLAKISVEQKEEAIAKHTNVTKMIARLITIPDVYAESHKAWKILNITVRKAKKVDGSGFVPMLYSLGENMYKKYCNITPDRYFAEACDIENTVSHILVNVALQAEQRHAEKGSDFREKSRFMCDLALTFKSVDFKLSPELINMLSVKNPKKFDKVKPSYPMHRPRQQTTVRTVRFADAPVELKETKETKEKPAMPTQHRRHSSFVKNGTVNLLKILKAPEKEDAPHHRRNRRSSCTDLDLNLISVTEEPKELQQPTVQFHKRRRSSLPSAVEVDGFKIFTQHVRSASKLPPLIPEDYPSSHSREASRSFGSKQC